VAWAGAAPRASWRAVIAEAFDAQRSRFFLWAPVCLGVGIAAYFALPREPGLLAMALPFLLALIIRISLPGGSLPALLATALVLAGLGGLVAKLRVEAVRAPVLTKTLPRVSLTGRLERIEPKATRGERLTILLEKLGELPPDATPRRVRVRTMRNSTVPLAVGQRVSTTATLSPPAKPAIPGGFDFARTAWFSAIGGVGYTFSDITPLPPLGAPALRERYVEGIENLRAAINARISAVLAGETGAIAEALITGERGGITEATNQAFKNSGLFHILSISGLHMVIMAGAVFYSLRLLLALAPAVALNFKIKKWAAMGGIAGALAYLAISGGEFATVRSAVMIIIMFVAVLLDRPALALRNVALSALIILFLYPESLFDPGFQMSYAAVTGLIATYEEVRKRFARRSEPHPVLRVAMFFGGIVMSTMVATVAVAPIAAYHFHQSQQYAVLANLLAIPICNFLVMPAALAALVLMPFGLEALGLWPMGVGIALMSWCASLVSALPGSVGHLPAVPTATFALFIIGGLWLAIWEARWRLLGAGLAVTSLALAPFMERPDILVARGGELVAVRGADGALSALPARQSKFELERWLEHDGDARSAADAMRARGFTCDKAGCVTQFHGLTLAASRHPASIGEDCARADIVVLSVPRPRRGCEGTGKVIDFFDVWREGTHAIYVGAEAGGKPEIRIDTVAAHRGDRPWARQIPPHVPRPTIGRRRHGTGSGDADGERLSGRAGEAAGADTGLEVPAFVAQPQWLAPSLRSVENGAPDADLDAESGEASSSRAVEAPALPEETEASASGDLDEGMDEAR